MVRDARRRRNPVVVRRVPIDRARHLSVPWRMMAKDGTGKWDAE
jgi:hypothetical protein